MYSEEIDGYCSCLNDLENWFDDMCQVYDGNAIPKTEIVKILDGLKAGLGL